MKGECTGDFAVKKLLDHFFVIVSIKIVQQSLKSKYRFIHKNTLKAPDNKKDIKILNWKRYHVLFSEKQWDKISFTGEKLFFLDVPDIIVSY